MTSQPVTFADLPDPYHDYAFFGVPSNHDGSHERNQDSKGPVIRAYIQWAIAKSRTAVDTPVSFAELFCADGYYAMVARRLGATTSVGYDNGRDPHFASAPLIADRLGLDDVAFVHADVQDFQGIERADVVANVGGLYHVVNPVEILQKSYDLADKFLVVQSAVSLATDDPDYFETPAPGWDWGCRMSRQSFDKAIRAKGWNILDSHFNILEGNTRPEDRGSVYYLVAKPGALDPTSSNDLTPRRWWQRLRHQR